ncbi:MAG TPA: hypothetical protein VKY33_07525 [Flavobacterium sp.]|nr:hypothetical protein [Flavobacterium sp.]
MKGKFLNFLKKFYFNFEQAKCGQCGCPQEYFRIPKNWRQFLWGGYTCPNCHSELDKFGDVIKK